MITRQPDGTLTIENFDENRSLQFVYHNCQYSNYDFFIHLVEGKLIASDENGDFYSVNEDESFMPENRVKLSFLEAMGASRFFSQDIQKIVFRKKFL